MAIPETPKAARKASRSSARSRCSVIFEYDFPYLGPEGLVRLALRHRAVVEPLDEGQGPVDEVCRGCRSARR
ncbi:MAG: hypothetical protein MZU95_08930 [Desulfomicrobium escambiense]|nr:hypothetical protein [Desulfomicrobium escambiense]